jgi:hypothetical protein
LRHPGGNEYEERTTFMAGLPGRKPPAGDRKGAGTYQMLWDCKFCGTEGLLGITHRHCPNCGSLQDPATRYFPKEEDMVALEDHEYVGADRICPACGQPNSAASTYCAECGADLATGAVAAMRGARDLGVGVAETDTRRDLVKDEFDAEMRRVGVVKDKRPVFMGLTKVQLWAVAGVVILVAIIAAIVYAVTYRGSAEGQVDSLAWRRVIVVESFQQVSDSSWQDQMPGDAYGSRCEERQRSTRRVVSGSHEECRDVDQGDGSFRRVCQTVNEYRDEPVYDTWCSFTVDRWEVAREVTAESEGPDSPLSWPQVTLAAGSGGYGQEREARRYGRYTVAFGDDMSCTFDDQARWEQFKLEDRVKVDTYITGEPDCDTLQVIE